VEREKHSRDGVPQRGIKWVFQLDRHPAPNLIITLKLQWDHRTIAFYSTAQVITIILLPVDVAVFVLLSCYPSVGSPPPPAITYRIPVLLIVCRPSRLIYTIRHLALNYVITACLVSVSADGTSMFCVEGYVNMPELSAGRW
jgi:hypothetical protein